MNVNGYEIGPSANLQNAVLVGAWLEGVDLSGADLTGADLSGALLSRANLARARLSGASLSRARLSDAKLQFADLTDTDLTGADLSNVDATAAILRGAQLDHTTKLDNAAIDANELARAKWVTRPIGPRVGGTYRVERCDPRALEATLNRRATQGWSLVSVIPDIAGDDETVSTDFVVVWTARGGS